MFYSILNYMNESMQITFMQLRIIRMFAQKMNNSISQAASLLYENGALNFIRQCFDSLHLEGDEGVYEDVERFLNAKGVTFNA